MSRVVQFVVVLAMAAAALLCATLGYFLLFCEGVPEAIFMAVIVAGFLLLAFLPVQLAVLGITTLVVAVVEPFKTPERRRRLRLALVPVLLALMAAGAGLSASRTHMPGECSMGVWH